MKDKDKALDLILRAFVVFDDFQCSHTWLGWRTDGEYAPVSLSVSCSDLWNPGSDSDDLTVDNIGVLEKALEDIKAIHPKGRGQTPVLFCSRLRKKPPPESYFKYIPKEIHHLFRECGEDGK